MQKFILFTLMLLLSVNSFAAKKIHVTCWSSSQIIYKDVVSEVYPGDGYIVAKTKMDTNFIFGDCVIRYKTKDVLIEFKK